MTEAAVQVYSGQLWVKWTRKIKIFVFLSWYVSDHDNIYQIVNLFLRENAVQFSYLNLGL